MPLPAGSRRRGPAHPLVVSCSTSCLHNTVFSLCNIQVLQQQIHAPDTAASGRVEAVHADVAAHSSAREALRTAMLEVYTPNPSPAPVRGAVTIC